MRYFPYVTLTGIGHNEKLNPMEEKEFILLRVFKNGVNSGSIRRVPGALIGEKVVESPHKWPSKARRRLENGRGEAGNVHFRPLFPERPCDALPLDTVGKYPDRARISKDGQSRYIPCIYATIGRIEIFRVSKTVHFCPSRPHRTAAQATEMGIGPVLSHFESGEKTRNGSETKNGDESPRYCLPRHYPI